MLLQRWVSSTATVGLVLFLSVTAWGDLAERLLSKDPDEQKAAHAEFERLDQKGREALVPVFEAALESGTKGETATLLLSEMGVTSIPVAERLLASPNTRTRKIGIHLLSRLKTQASVPLLTRVAKSDQDERCRWSALFVLCTQNHVTADLVPALSNAIDHKDECSIACRALEALGPEAEPSVPALIKLLETTPLSEIDPTSCNNATDALKVLASLGSKAQAAIPVLVKVLGSDSISNRMGAGRALNKIGPAAEPAILAAVDSLNVRQREGAMSALESMQPYSKAAIAVFLKLAFDENDNVNATARACLRRVDSDAARQALTLADERYKARWAQAEAAKVENAKLLRTKGQIVASEPPDANHKYPRDLDVGLPIRGYNNEEYFVTIRSGEDWPSVASIWARLKNGYKQLWSAEGGGGSVEGEFGEIALVHYHGTLLLHLPWFYSGSGHYRSDYFFKLDTPNRLEPVEIEYAADWYHSKLKSGESIDHGEQLSFSDNDLKFTFYIWNEGDAGCCPSAGMVTGSFKIVGDASPGRKLKLVVKDCKRGPIPESDK